MINYEYAELFLENDVQKNFIITDGVVSVAGGSFIYNDYTYLLTNDDLKSVPRITEMLTDENDLDFGRCNSNYIEFSIAADVIPLIGKACRVYLWMDDNKDTLFRIGKYRITSDKATADRNYRNIVAYDKLNEMNTADVTDWYNSLFPSDQSVISVAAMRASFCRHFNIDDATDTSDMVNDQVTCGKTISPGDGGFIDGATILRALCSINGGFGNISRNGDFRCIVLKSGLIGLYPRIDLYPSEELYPREDITTLIDSGYYIPPLAYEDYYTENITSVQIREDDDDLGVAVGESGNDYILEGNFILFGKGASELEEIATRLLGKIHGMSYMPFNVRAFGDPVFEVGDPVRFRTGDVIVNSYILKRTLTGTSAMEDQYESVGNQYRDDKATNISTDIAKLKSKTVKIEKNVDRVSVELTEQLDDTVVGSYAYITSQEIGTKVSNGTFTSTVQQLNNSISLKVSQGDVSSSLSLESGQVTLNSNRLVVNSTNFTLASNGNATFSGVVEAATISGSDIVGGTIVTSGTYGWTRIAQGQYQSKPTELSDNKYIHIVGWEEPTVAILSGSAFANLSASGGLVLQNCGIDVRGSGGIQVGGYSVLTTNSTISASQLPSTVLTTSSSISTDQISFGKTFTATGTSGSYTMKLQSITIDGTTYVMYAEKQ